MKKQSTTLIGTLCASILLSACAREPIASDKALVKANKAVEVAEEYIAGEISGDEACDALDEIYEALSYTSDYTYEEKSADQQKWADDAIQFDIFMLSLHISNDSGMFGDAETFEKVEESLQNLKDTIKEYD